MPVGFMTLREFVMQRPSLRTDALNILLELTTHPGMHIPYPNSYIVIDRLQTTEKVTRGAAIITVKRWVPDVQPMDGMVREFALQMLRRLQKRPTDDQKRVDVQMNGDENMEDGQLPAEDLVQTAYLPEHIELPAQKAHVLQHVELLFALSVKVPEFLDEYVVSLITNAPTYWVTEYSTLMVKWKLRSKRQYKN
jgi:symplekin